MELKEITAPLLKWWWLLVASTLVAAVASFLAVRQQPPVYSASTTMMIGSAIEDPNPTSNQVWLSQQLATTYADIVSREPVRLATMEALGLTWLPGYSARPIQNTQLLEISVTDTDPLRAQAVANELANQLVLKSPTYSPESQARQDFINLQLDELEVKIQETQDDINTKQDELANMVSARQIADTQSQIAALQAKLTTLQSNYAGLLINTQQGALNTLTVIEAATAVQVGPNVIMTILTSAAIGLVLAAGAAYLLEYLDNSIKSPDDVKRLTGLPTLAGIAAFRGDRYREKLITISHPRSPVSEAYRSLRTGIQFSTIDRPGNTTLMVTSPNPTEGKSVTVANLAVVFAQAGHKVLLIDADLRRPVQHRIFQVPNARGLTSYLLESHANHTHEQLRDLTIQKTGIEGLFHPTAVYDDFTSGVTYRDLPEIAAFMEAFHTADGAVFLDVISYHAGEGIAAAEWVLEGSRQGPSGVSGDSLVVRRFRVDGLTLIEVQGGLIVRAADYGDPIPLVLAEGGAVVLPEGDTLRAGAESATGPPPRR